MYNMYFYENLHLWEGTVTEPLPKHSARDESINLNSGNHKNDTVVLRFGEYLAQVANVELWAYNGNDLTFWSHFLMLPLFIIFFIKLHAVKG